jgi:hypothetical protein
LTCGTLQALLLLLDPNYQQHQATLLQNSAPSKQLILVSLNQALNPGGIYLPYWRILEPAVLDMKMVLIYRSQIVCKQALVTLEEQRRKSLAT